MLPIAQINVEHLMRRSLIGTNGTDPVVPHKEKKPPVVRYKTKARGVRRLMLRGTS